MHEGNTLYLLPVQGSDTNWYKNLLVDQTLKISVGGAETGARGKPIVGEVPLERLWHAVPSYPTTSEVWLDLLENYAL